MLSNSPDRAQKRRRAYKAGLLAEIFALMYFFLHGYHILAWRYKTKTGEIDLIVRKGDQIVMVEVKARASLDSGIEAVSVANRKRIENAANWFLAGNSDSMEYVIRYDIFAVRLIGNFIPAGWRHLDNAWEACS